MKDKIYLSNCVVDGKNRQLIIVNNNNESIFFANDGIYQA